MSDLMLKVLVSRVPVPPEHRELLAKGSFDYSRKEKKEYRRSIAPRLSEFRQALARSYAEYCRRDPATPETWATSIALNIVRRGYATVADTLGMTVVGRRKVSDVVKALKAVPSSRHHAES